ncbi:LysE family translocator [Phytohalomonas tamaricis]|uniref:LysE family translocator n=1 Tax=Phytohalomonas tamaricis TaxID=2081032 RepID=UPI0021D4313E|nr:LysE family translocator [Phytohalomonas tamaricis]
MQTLVSFMLFAFVASITPGPTNLLVLVQSLRHGLKATLPLVVAACLAAAAIVWLVGCGLGGLLNAHPSFQTAMGWLGVAWLSYLAWRIFVSAPSGVDIDGEQANAVRFRIRDAAGLQLSNPKTWMMALAVVGVFAGHVGDRIEEVTRLALLFFAISVPCLSVWALLGTGAAVQLCTGNDVAESAHGHAVAGLRLAKPASGVNSTK